METSKGLLASIEKDPTSGYQLQQVIEIRHVRCQNRKTRLLCLQELPRHESFHIIDTAFEGLANLRPKLLTALLTRCRSVKVKRLFFVYPLASTRSVRSLRVKREQIEEAYDLFANQRDGALKVAITP